MTVEAELRKIVVECLGVLPGQVTLGAAFLDDLGADSLDTLEIAMAAEGQFDVEISDNELQKITTFGDAVRAIERLR